MTTFPIAHQPMTRGNMRQHVESLAAAHDIRLETRWVTRSADAFCIREADGAADEVHTPPIRSAITYATALHEIGHVLGRYQKSQRLLVRERWAWQWARDNALIWTPAMEKLACGALAWIETHAKQVSCKQPATGG